MPASPKDRGPSLAALIRSALFVDAVIFLGFRRETDMTDAERELGDRWLLWARSRAVFVSTAGKSKAQIVEDAARAMRRAGPLKE